MIDTITQLIGKIIAGTATQNDRVLLEHLSQIKANSLKKGVKK